MTMRLTPRLGRGIAALGLAAPLVVACNNDPESGNVTITYSFAPGVDCDSEAVEEVRVQIGEPNIESDACDNGGGEIVLSGVNAGNYDLFVFGIDGDMDVVLDNLGGSDPTDRIEVVGGSTKDVDIVLGLAPARLEVRMAVLNDGFPAQCSSDAITVKGVRAEAWDFGSSDMLKSHDFDLCDFDGFLPVPDEEREINGRRFDGVVMQPLDGSGNPVGDALELSFGSAVGAGKLAQVDVSCDNDVCTAEVLGGDPGPATGDPSDSGDDPTGGDSANPTSGTGDDTTSGGDTTG